jgi:hypothetical protein
MPEVRMELEPYAYSFSPEARQTRKQFPSQLVQTLLDIVDELAVNPDAYPERTQKMGRTGDILLYKHQDPPLEITYEIDRGNRKLYFIHFAAPVIQLKEVFVSYSHADTEWLERVKKYLNPLETMGILRIWDDQQIKPGADWLAEIKKSLASAKVALLLVTQDFLHSAFIQKQEVVSLLSSAEKDGVKITWIAVKASTVEDSPISKFQALNNPARPLEGLNEAERNQVLVEIYKKVKDVALAN